MTKLPLAQSAQPFKMTLEAAVFDWRSTRVQFTFGFAITLIFFALVIQEFFATRFLPSEYIAVEMLAPNLASALEYSSQAQWSTNPLLLLEVLLFKNHSWWYRAVTFTVAALTALTTGLITQDIAIRYGNRIGAAAAVFAALLFVAMPLQSSLVLPMSLLPAALSNLLALGAVFLDMRFRLLHETRYYWMALLSLVVSGVLDLRGAIVAVLGIAFCRLFITERGKKRFTGPLNSYIGLIVYSLPTLLFLATHLSFASHLSIISSGSTQAVPGVNEVLTPLITGETIGGESFGKVMQRALPILFATVFSIAMIRLILGSLWVRPLLFAASWLASLLVSWQFLNLHSTVYSSPSLTAIFLAPAFCILLSLSALPSVDSLTRKSRVLFTALGATALSGLICCWGLLLIVQIHDSFDQARELMLFKLQLAHRMLATDGKLVVINPPFDSRKETDQKSDQATEADKVPDIRDREQLVFIGLLDSPLSSTVIPITTHRRKLASFVRLSKKEHATPDPNIPATSVTDYFVWSKELRRLMPLYYVGASTIKIDVKSKLRRPLQTEPREISKLPATEWAQLPSSAGYIEKLEDGFALHSGEKEDLLVWFPHDLLDPTRTNLVRVQCSKRVDSQKTPVYLIFKGVDSDDTGVIKLHRTETQTSTDTVLEARIRGFAEWNRHSAIISMGIKLPAGSDGIVLKSIETIGGASKK